jgi:nucleotide-binding universal stress UspA family protein
MYSHPFVLKHPGARCVPALLRNPSLSRGMFGSKPALRKPLIPVDGSPESMRAVEYVIAQVGPGGAQVHLINVQQPVMAGDVNFFTSAKMVADKRRAAGERALRTARRMLDANHIEHTSEVVFGKPVEAIVRYAAERGCTKIVMGTKGRSLLANLLTRSVASRVVRHAHTPVTLVKERPRHSLRTLPVRLDEMAPAGALTRFRPTATKLALTASQNVCRSLALVSGVSPLYAPSEEDSEDGAIRAAQWLYAHGLARPGGPIIVLSASADTFGTADTLQVARLPM